jgi:hypothetical protein
LAAREDCGHPSTVLVQAVDGVDASVDSAQAPTGRAVACGAVAEATLAQLGERQHSVLGDRQLAERAVRQSMSTFRRNTRRNVDID